MCSCRTAKAWVSDVSSFDYGPWKWRYKLHAGNPGESNGNVKKTVPLRVGGTILGHLTEEMLKGKQNNFHICKSSGQRKNRIVFSLISTINRNRNDWFKLREKRLQTQKGQLSNLLSPFLIWSYDYSHASCFTVLYYCQLGSAVC